MAQSSTSYRIDTFAGGGVGDGGPAVEAHFYVGHDGFLLVATDGSGNVYVTDPENHRGRRIDTAGVISTFAGTGQSGFSGDGGSANQAALSYPASVAVDGAGNVYVTDSGNNRIRKVDATGTITTIAGTGAYGFSGDSGSAVQAALSYPAGVAVDGAGNVYGTVKLTDLWTYSAPWTLHKLLILRSSADRFRLQTPRIALNLTVPSIAFTLHSLSGSTSTSGKSFADGEGWEQG